MNLNLKGKNYLVAGGSKGIGRRVTEQLLSSGASVYVYSRSADELPKFPGLMHQVCDFTTEDFEQLELPDSIHGAIYCPGSINLRSFRSLNLTDYQQDLETNFFGAVKFLKGCISGLRKSGTKQASSVVLFSTVACQKGMPMHASIASAKGAIEGLSKSLAAEWAPKVRVNSIAPAMTDTPLAANFLSTEEKRMTMNQKYPMKRVGNVDDIASVATFLLSPQSDWITGQTIGVDGGLSSLHT